ncbi:MAG: helix-turn-helix domain-containing protein [Chitinophaga rupis]
MRVVIYLPPNFYSAVASSIVETLQTVNDISGSQTFTTEFVSQASNPTSRSGILFPAKRRPSGKIDLLILLSGINPETKQLPEILQLEKKFVAPLVKKAVQQDAIIAGTCGASLLLASLGLLDGKRSTIAWWAQQEAIRLFPKVRWEPSKMVIRQGRIYTSGAVYAGIDLLSALLVDLGLAKEEKIVRKLLAIPSLREFQTPYEMILAEIPLTPFEEKLSRIISDVGLENLTIERVGQRLSMTYRTLSRKFTSELFTSPGKWLQNRRLDAAKKLLEETALSVSEICYHVGYQDLASFSRLFLKTTGMTPGEFRRQAAA